MTTWRYGYPQHHSDYPDPGPEIEHLVVLQDQRGLPAHLLLGNREHPPGSQAEPGDELLLCLPEAGKYVAVARAMVSGRATQRTIPEGHEAIYDVGPRRWWLPVRIERLPRALTEEDLGLAESDLQPRGQAFVWRLES